MAAKSGTSSPLSPSPAGSLAASMAGGAGRVPSRSRMSAGGPGGTGGLAGGGMAAALSSGDTSTSFILLSTSLRPMAVSLGLKIRAYGRGQGVSRSARISRIPAAQEGQGHEVRKRHQRPGERVELGHLPRRQRPDRQDAPLRARRLGIAPTLQECRQEPAAEGT